MGPIKFICLSIHCSHCTNWDNLILTRRGVRSIYPIMRTEGKRLIQTSRSSAYSFIIFGARTTGTISSELRLPITIRRDERENKQETKNIRPRPKLPSSDAVTLAPSGFRFYWQKQSPFSFSSSLYSSASLLWLLFLLLNTPTRVMVLIFSKPNPPLQTQIREK